MEDKIIEEVKGLQDKQEEVKDSLKQEFITFLEKSKQTGTIKKVKEKGMFTKIMVSNKLFPVSMAALNKYAPVVKNNILPEPSLYFLWSTM